MGTQWTPKQNINKDPFYKKISTLVDDINTASESAENHQEFFEEKLITLKDFLEREKQRSALLEERIIQAESMKARTDAARETAEKTIRKKIFRYNAKPHTAAFLQDYWSQVLFFYINRDDDYHSEHQQQARKIIDNLLIFTPETLSTHFDSVSESILWHLHHMGLALTEQEQTLDGLHNEFNSSQQAVKDEQAAAAEAAAATVAAQEQTAAHAAAELAAAASTTLERKDSTQHAAQPTPPPQPVEKITASPVAASAPETTAIEVTPALSTTTQDALEIDTSLFETPELIDEDEDEIFADEDIALEDIFDKQADMLRADTWFRLSNANHDKLKIKLAAVIKHNGNYIFVNREGAKMITAKKPEVAELLRCGELSIVDDTVFFDRALESVIQSLRT